MPPKTVTTYEKQNWNSSVVSRFLNVKNVSAERMWTPREFQTVETTMALTVQDRHMFTPTMDKNTELTHVLLIGVILNDPGRP